jgi:photosystem II stability/assembly factor-like uncharacterized protein
VIGAVVVAGLAAAGTFAGARTSATPATSPTTLPHPVTRTASATTSPLVAPGPPAALDAVACPTVSVCIAVGGAGGVEVSRTAGRTWSAVTVPTRHYLYGVACDDPAHCVAVGDDGTALVTGDGGSSWKSYPTGVGIPLSSVACPGDSRCYAVGDADTVIATDDGGAHWQRQLEGTGVVDGVACSTPTRCAAVTSSAVANLATSDGSTWKPVTVPFPSLDGLAPLNGVGCSGSTCVAVGGHGLIASSLRGGATWSADQSPTSDSLMAAACRSPLACVAVGQAGTILTTEGSGPPWKSVASHTGQTLLGVTCPSLDQCVAVGSGGAVVTSDDGGAQWVVRAGKAAPSPSLRLLVVGDSFAHTLAMGVARNATAWGVDVIDGSLDGCALVRGSPVLVGTDQLAVSGPCAPTGTGWPSQYQSDVSTSRPTLSLLVLGPWDLSTRKVDGKWEWPGQSAYDDSYAQLITTAVHLLSAGGGRVAITTVPVVRSSGPELCVPPPATVTDCPTSAQRVVALNQVARWVVGVLGGKVTLIDLSHQLSPTGVFTNEVDGVVVRAADGVHLSEPGGEWLTPWLLPQLQRANR